MHAYLHTFQPEEDAAEPESVRILSMEAAPLVDPQKIRITVQLTPFKIPPDLSFKILDSEKVEVSSVSMIETVLDEFNFVMHLRKINASLMGTYQLTAEILYKDIGTVDRQICAFEIY